MGIYDNLGTEEGAKKILFDEIAEKLRPWGIYIHRDNPEVLNEINPINFAEWYYSTNYNTREIPTLRDSISSLEKNDTDKNELIGKIFERIYDLEHKVRSQELIINKLIDELQNKNKEDASTEQSTAETNGDGVSC